MKTLTAPLLALCAALCLAACGEKTQPQFIEAGNPATLAEWGQLALSKGVAAPSDGVTAYDLNTPLFTDYAHKLRTVWIPGGKSAAYDSENEFDFPVGTVITKTFYYPREAGAGDTVLKTDLPWETKTALNLSTNRLVETRVLAHRESGWIALPYVWNDAQTEAVLKRTGDVKELTLMSEDGAKAFSYVVPNANQCSGCHAVDSGSRNVHPIGPKARHLNRDMVYGGTTENQLAHWTQAGLLSGAPEDVTKAPANAVWTDTNRSISDRARAYADINCSHCHSTIGPADTSGLHLTPDTPVGPHLGICKMPIAAGTGTGDRQFDIVPGDADASIFTFRLGSTNPAVMMPEVGRSLAHDEGLALISAWINGLDGSCGG